MIYEKPRLVELGSSTAMGGIDCVPGSTAIDKCQNGGSALLGDCQQGSSALKCKPGGAA